MKWIENLATNQAFNKLLDVGSNLLIEIGDLFEENKRLLKRQNELIDINIMLLNENKELKEKLEDLKCGALFG